MLYKTKGIVLNTIKYSETSIIAKIYTDSFGLVSYIIRSSRKSRTGIKTGLFQPLTLMDFVAYHKKKTGLHTIKEITGCHQFTGIPYDIKKSSVAIFIAEVLNKAIKEEEQNKILFYFIYNSIELLDKTEGRISEFNLYFLLELSQHLGFYPQGNYNERHKIFNLYDGHFQEHIPEHPYFIDTEMSRHFYKLIGKPLKDLSESGIPATIRKELLNKILDYYRIHLNGFNTLKSYAVLEEIFI